MGHKVNSQNSKDIRVPYYTTSCNVTCEILRASPSQATAIKVAFQKAKKPQTTKASPWSIF